MTTTPGYKRKWTGGNIGWKDGTTCHCKNCHCYSVVTIPCGNEFLVCNTCLLNKCNQHSTAARVNYIKIATTHEDRLEEAMQTL